MRISDWSSDVCCSDLWIFQANWKRGVDSLLSRAAPGIRNSSDVDRNRMTGLWNVDILPADAREGGRLATRLWDDRLAGRQAKAATEGGGIRQTLCPPIGKDRQESGERSEV